MQFVIGVWLLLAGAFPVAAVSPGPTDVLISELEAQLQEDPESALGRAREEMTKAGARNDIPGQAALQYFIAVYSDGKNARANGFLAALKLYETIGDSLQIATILTNLGELARSDLDFENSLAYLGRAETIFHEAKNELGLAHVKNRQAAVYFEIGSRDPNNLIKSITLASDSLEFARRTGNDNLIFNNLNIIGASESASDQPQKALEHLQEALEVVERNEWHYLKPNILNNIARNYLVLNELDKAVETAEISLKMATESDIKPYILEAAQSLREASKRLGRYQEALEYADIYATARDDYFYNERNRLVQDLHVQYESSRKERELILEKNRRQMATSVFITVSVSLLFVMMLVVAVLLKKKNREINYKNATISDQFNKLKELLAQKDYYFYRFNLVATSGSMGIWEMDLTDNRFDWDAQMYALFGLPPDSELDPARIMETIVYPDDRAIIRDQIEAAVAGDGMLKFVFRVQPDPADIRWLEAHAVVVSDDEGNPQKMIGAVRDVTQAKEDEAANLTTQEKYLVSQKHESLGVMAGGIAHDFNNLLTVIIGHLDLVCDDILPGNPVIPSVKSAMQAAQKASVLTQKMLDYSGKTRTLANIVNLDETIQKLTPDIQRIVPGNIILQVTLSSGHQQIRADLDQLHQIIFNLVKNSVEAISSDKGSISISTAVKTCDASFLEATRTRQKPKAGQFLTIEITDTGCGMDDITKARLFDPFFSTKFTGRGLGMASVLGIVSGHGGAIMVESQPDAGSTITVLFPVLSANLID